MTEEELADALEKVSKHMSNLPWTTGVEEAFRLLAEELRNG